MDMITEAAKSWPATKPPAPCKAAQTTARAVGGEFLTFRLGTEEYGIDILRVQEIRSLRTAHADRQRAGRSSRAW
jgi:purine-binding chemotaxis protein CheW